MTNQHDETGIQQRSEADGRGKSGDDDDAIARVYLGENWLYGSFFRGISTIFARDNKKWV